MDELQSFPQTIRARFQSGRIVKAGELCRTLIVAVKLIG
jgi:hypothetical protein